MRAVEAFRAGNYEDGERWALGHLEQRTCTRTPQLVEHLAKREYDKAADLLAFIAEHL